MISLSGQVAAKAIGEIIEADRREIEGDNARLTDIMQDVSARTGEACMKYNERGEVFVHPDLALELERPGNERLKEALLYIARLGAARERQ